jgi:deazaflavin-dependent oxidoreductase (nitroreductase family)
MPETGGTLMSDWNAQLINTLRTNHGEVPAGPMAGRPLLILTTKGAKSGETREAVLTFSRDDGRYVVAATAGGAPIAPSWYHNVLANPAVQVEASGETFTATATEAPPAERERLWAQHVAARPEFAEYPEKSGRTIPVVTLRRID